MIAGARLAGSRNPGSARGSLIFVHGVGSTAAIWDAQLQAFGAEWLCAAIELRGNGASKPDPDPATITREGFAEDVLDVADALRAERFTLVGCSLGGVVAFELLRCAPERLERLVLLGTFARYPNAQTYAATIERDAREAGAMRVFGERRAAKLGLPPSRTYETIEQMACKSVECYVASTYATWTGDYLDVLPSVRVPTLVAHGERDMVAPAALSEEIARAIPGAELTSVPDAGHVANADNPTAFNALLRDFLERTSATTLSS
jgi:3-oxoadipate enol-lactonase